MEYRSSSGLCPQCGQIDAVRKVSAVVSDGTKWNEQLGVAPNLAGSGFYLVGLRGSSKTDLAQQLAPGVNRPGGIGWRIALALTALLLGSAMACGLSLFAVTPAFGMFACGNWVLGIMVIATVGGIAPLLGIPGVKRRQAAYDYMIESARAKWSRLYYCARDDVVFDPEQSAMIVIPALSAYLYG